MIRPGPQKVRANSSLSQALQAAGGISHRGMPGVNYIGGRAYLIVAVQGNQNTIELLRLEPNGTVERRVLSYRPASNLGGYQ